MSKKKRKAKKPASSKKKVYVEKSSLSKFIKKLSKAKNAFMSKLTKKRIIITVLAVIGILLLYYGYSVASYYYTYYQAQTTQPVEVPEKIAAWVQEHATELSDEEAIKQTCHDQGRFEDGTRAYGFLIDIEYKKYKDIAQMMDIPYCMMTVYFQDNADGMPAATDKGTCTTYESIPLYFWFNGIYEQRFQYEYTYVFSRPNGVSIKLSMLLGSVPKEQHAQKIAEYAEALVTMEDELLIPVEDSINPEERFLPQSIHQIGAIDLYEYKEYKDVYIEQFDNDTILYIDSEGHETYIDVTEKQIAQLRYLNNTITDYTNLPYVPEGAVDTIIKKDGEKYAFIQTYTTQIELEQLMSFLNCLYLGEEYDWSVASLDIITPPVEKDRIGTPPPVNIQTLDGGNKTKGAVPCDE